MPGRTEPNGSPVNTGRKQGGRFQKGPPAEAGGLGRLIDNFVRALEANDFEARLRRLEEPTP